MQSTNLSLIVLSVFVTIVIQGVIGQSCVTCENKEACCGGEKCCDGGTMCCPASAICCNSTCCDGVVESCCPDPDNGGVCCMKQDTFCCPPQKQFDLPSRCCPRWNVCCNGGSYGCCDPGSGKAADNNAWALFSEVSWSGQSEFKGLNIDLSTGYKTENMITGFNTWGEVTRKFTFDPQQELFYLPQCDFIKNYGEITLFTVDPKKGTTTPKIVTGAKNLVTGFLYDTNKGNIMMATEILTNNQRTGYFFYTVDVNTAVATLVSSSNFTQGNDNYAGWFRSISADSKYVYRLGYQDVVNQNHPGIGITDISQSEAKTKWRDDIPIPKQHDLYATIDVFGDYFLSLSPSEESVLDLFTLDLVKWNVQGEATIIANFTNAHKTPYFGPIATYVSVDQNIFSALVVDDNILDSTYDRWALIVVDLSNNNEAKYINISPFMIAETDSISGFGIPANSMLIFD